MIIGTKWKGGCPLETDKTEQILAILGQISKELRLARVSGHVESETDKKRPGTTRKVSISLPEEYWRLLENRSESSNMSRVLRSIIIRYFEMEKMMK